MNYTNKMMVFDVESVGLYGEGFAVAYVKINRDGIIIEDDMICCSADHAEGTQDGRVWVAENVIIESCFCVYSTPKAVRNWFWKAWMEAKNQGYTLWADCNWPVEANFLSACINDNLEERIWSGPYPFFDIAILRFAMGFDPLKVEDRREDELPIHNPLADARQSARLLSEALQIAKSKGLVT